VCSSDLPRYAVDVIAPVSLQLHRDAQAHASKLIGFDADGRRCFVRQLHTATADCFDIDEFPVEVALFRERHIAWRMRDGRWLLHSDRLERLESCRPQLIERPDRIVAEAELGL
jgi:hypothetical protein